MKINKKYAFLLCFFLIYLDPAIADIKDEYAWLHVEGRYLRTSPYANPANSIFTSVGVCWGTDPSGTKDQVASYCKSKGCNTIRIAFATLPNPPGIGGSPTGWVLNDVINNFITPIMQACKNKSMYVYLDMHEFFRRKQSGDGWLPSGQVWNSSDIALWINHWQTIINVYKDEPWVMGYELCNEVNNGDTAYIRNAYIQCIQAVRQLDKKHIVILGNNNFAHSENIECTWSPVNLKPDAPYNQAMFAFHEYTFVHDASGVGPVIDDLWTKYQVPLIATEFGSDTVIGSPTTTDKRNFEIGMFDMFRQRKINWTIWRLQGSYPNYSGPYYNDIWQPQTAYGSAVPSTGTVPSASRIVCRSYPNGAYADGSSLVSVYADVCESQGCRLFPENRTINFSITGSGTWENGTRTDLQVATAEGMAEVKIKAGSNPGSVTVTASCSGLETGDIVIPLYGTPKRVTCTASPTTIAADGTGKSLLTASIRDETNNIVQLATGQVSFGLSGPAGSGLWVTDTIPATKRDIVDNGNTYLFLKAGTAAGDAVITVSCGSLQTDTVVIGIGQAATPVNGYNPFEYVKAYPNPFNARTSARIRFSNLPEKSTLRIYTLSGKLINSTYRESAGDIEWDATNWDGNRIAKGIYIYVLVQEGTKHTGKLLIR